MAFVEAAIAVGGAIGLGEGVAAAIGGGAILGAGAGGLYGAVTGGNVGQDMLIGGLLGAGGAYGSGSMAWGSDATDAAFGVGSGGAGPAPAAFTPNNTVVGSIGAGPAPTTFAPGTTSLGAAQSSFYSAPSDITSYSGINAAPEYSPNLSYSSQVTQPSALSQAAPSLTQGISATAPGALTATTPSSLTNGMEAAGAWMNRHPIMTGLGLYTAASALGLGKQPGVSLPAGAAPSNMDTSYFKLDPSTFQPNRPQPVTGPVKPGVTPPYPNYVQNPYQPTGYASGGIASFSKGKTVYEDIQQYESMLAPQHVNTEDPSWVKDIGIVVDTDPNTKNLSPLDKTKYQLAKTYARSGMPTSAGIGLNQQTAPYGTINTDPYMVQQAQQAQQAQQTQNAASGGIMGYSLGGYAHGGNPRLLRGPGDGMSDDIPATIGQRQPARLADGEFVVPADVVSHLGNGSTEAGAKKLHGMMDKIRMAKTGKKKQAPQLKTDKFIPS